MNIQVNNLNTSYIQKGRGPVIALLHGWGSSKDTFSQLLQTLSDNFCVIALDLPGFGQSEQPDPNWVVGDYVQFVKDFIAELGIENVYAYIAHSFGGHICIKGIATADLSSEKLVLIGSAGIKPRYTVKKMVYVCAAKVGKVIYSIPGLRNYRTLARERLYSSAQSADYLNAGSMKQIFTNVIKEDLTTSLKDIHIPTLLLWGSEDNQTPLEDARIMKKYITNATLYIQQRAGHFVHTDRPEKVAAWIGEFLK